MTVKHRPQATGKQTNRLLSLPAILSTAAIVAGIVILYIAWSTSAQQNVAAFEGGSGGYQFTVGGPGPGESAPGFTLSATDGGEVSLSDYAGQSVLLYFHEGGECQSCWNQIGDIEATDIDTFLLVDGEGTIVWRADYGGGPDYTMYLPTDGILADLDADRIDQ